MDLVDEQEDLPLALFDLFENAFEPLFKFSAVFGPSDQASHVEDEELFIFERIGNVALHDAQGEPFGDRCLADARLADQERIVLCPAAENLHRPADFLVSADDRVEFSRFGQVGEVSTIFI